MGVPLVIIHFRLGFSITKTSYWGSPHLWTPPKSYGKMPPNSPTLADARGPISDQRRVAE